MNLPARVLRSVCRRVALVSMPFVAWSAESRPNILLAIADDWSREHAGAYGCTWVRTPAFDRVAREGVLFNHAYTPNPKCSPARATLLTGRNPWQLEEAINHNSIFPATFAVYPAEELYDLGADPRCLKNLASDPALQDVKRGLRSELEATLRHEEDPRVLGNAAIFYGPSYRYRAPVQYTHDAWLRFQSAAP
jgi:hypothetical protein